MEVKNKREVMEFINECVVDAQASGMYNGESGAYIFYIKHVDFDEAGDVEVQISYLNTVWGHTDAEFTDAEGNEVRLNSGNGFNSLIGRTFARLEVCGEYYLTSWADDFTIADCAEVLDMSVELLLDDWLSNDDDSYEYDDVSEVEDWDVVRYCLSAYNDKMITMCKELEQDYINCYCAELAGYIYSDLIDVLDEYKG